MQSIIIVGPKKTGTSSLYQSLKQAQIHTHYLPPKESNILISEGIHTFIDSKKPIIDISPEYYSSFRALVNLKRLIDAEPKTIVIVLEREPGKRLRSHISYMIKKDQLDCNFTSQEWESVLGSELRFWDSLDWPQLHFCDLNQAFSLLDETLDLSLDRDMRVNEGGYKIRNKLLFKVAFISANVIRKNLFFARLVEIIAPLLRNLIYKKVASNDVVDVEKLIAEFAPILDGIRQGKNH